MVAMTSPIKWKNFWRNKEGASRGQCNYEFILASGRFFRHRMVGLESHRLVRECDFFFPFFCAMVRHGEKKRGDCSAFFLVVKFDWLAVAVDLWNSPARFRFYFRLRLHLDSVYSQFNDSSPPRPVASALS